MKKVIIFNAPPNSGKDVATSHVVDNLCQEGIPAYHQEFKENLFKATKACFGIDDMILEELYRRENKDLPSYFLVNNGKHISIRDAMINTSEKVLKPLFGKNVFGVMAANSLKEGINIFSDGGFVDEIKELEKEVGSENILLVHIYRDGCTFEGDSRNYVIPNTIPIASILNNGTEEEFLGKAYQTVTKWLQRGD